jgi:UDP-N-acetylmuramoyl-L-alanyl-D-glutamate--2,6-diaminopimelate ligase
MLKVADMFDLLAPLRLVAASDELDRPIHAVSADSRAVEQGTLFVAVVGGRFDGHRFLAAAAQQGAAAAIGTLAPHELAELAIPLPANLPYAQVSDSRLALAMAAAALHSFPSRDLVVIGVTGTDGKTTTSGLIEAILVEATRSAEAPHGRVGVITTVGARLAGAESDTGLHVTTPEAPDVQRFLAQMRDAGCRYAVVESTSHGLDQQRVGAVDFDVAVVTNITHEHLDYHGTRAAYVAAKARLFRALFRSPTKPNAPRCAVLNADDAGSFDALSAVLAEESAQSGISIPTHAYALATSVDRKPDVTASDIRFRSDCTEFLLHWWGGEFSVQSRLIGEFNVANVLAAASAALALGIGPEMIQAGVAGFAGITGRMERIDYGQPFLALVDFAHSPASLERALHTLRPLVGVSPNGTPGRLIAVFGSAGLRDRAKRRWMGQVSGRLADFTVITAEDPRTEDVNDICREIEAGVAEFVSRDRYTVAPDRREAIQLAVDMAQSGDIVTAFGKGHERSMCYGETEYPWSDQQAMLDALARRAAESGWQ